MTECKTEDTIVEYYDEDISDEDKSVSSSDRSSERSYNQNKRMKYNQERESKDIKKRLGVKRPLELENDPVVLERRQKQIDYGKNTVGYANYLLQIPIRKRTREHPRTPDKYRKYSRRSWDQLIKIWRKKLHTFDPDCCDDEEMPKIKHEPNESPIIKHESDELPKIKHEPNESPKIKHEPCELPNIKHESRE